MSYDTAEIFDRVLVSISGLKQISVAQLRGASRRREVGHARHLVMAICFRCGLSHSEIGRRFRRHHTSVMYGVNKVLTEARKNRGLARTIKDVRRTVSNTHRKSSEISTGRKSA